MMSSQGFGLGFGSGLWRGLESSILGYSGTVWVAVPGGAADTAGLKPDDVIECAAHGMGWEASVDADVQVTRFLGDERDGWVLRGMGGEGRGERDEMDGG